MYRGTDLALLGATTMNWRVRLRSSHGHRAHHRRVVVGYRSDAYLDPMSS
jgi:hypothetical protein